MAKSDIQPSLTLIIQDEREHKIRKKIASWKYYEIVDILRGMEISQQECYDAAQWAANMRAPGIYKKILGVTLMIG